MYLVWSGCLAYKRALNYVFALSISIMGVGIGSYSCPTKFHGSQPLGSITLDILVL